MARPSLEYCRPIASHVGEAAPSSMVRHRWAESSGRAGPAAGDRIDAARTVASQRRCIARRPLTGAGLPFSSAHAPPSWMKLVQLAPEPARADPEGGAELRVHMRLVAIAEVRRQQGERRPCGPQREAQPGETAQPLECAERHPRPLAE